MLQKKRMLGFCEYCKKFPATRVLSKDNLALLINESDDNKKKKQIMSCVVNLCGSCVYVFELDKMRRLVLRKISKRRVL